MESTEKPSVRPEVITLEDVAAAVPALGKHPKLVNSIFRLLAIDKVNHVHGKYCETLGVEFATRLATEEYRWKYRVDNYEILERFKEGPFITISNHPVGSYDGISLLHLVGSLRPDYKVMVNLILNKLQAMQPGFIAVDPQKNDDPEKRKVTLHGLREAIQHVKHGHPLGVFPAGAMSMMNLKGKLVDQPWKEVIIRLIKQLQVPVVPIYFHCRNSLFFDILGLIDWRLRTMRLPRELFRTYDKEIHVTVGEPISVDEQNKYASLQELSDFLREKTMALASVK